ncbi:hypothetical protein [Comamonas testosteroni]|jgi:hypothetical protein|uniref:hypothetical protein n=1 Tax=Comamonas testosteroni TaxID=285 RepID=UPI0026F350F6|nr:hypothetical protein [Comamonas testosteroni]
MRITPAQIIDFISDSLHSAMVTDRKIAEQYRTRGVGHSRSGRIASSSRLKEGCGVDVHAYKPDGLGGVIALCVDGHIRQFIA